MYATNYLETMVLNMVRGQPATAPTTVYMGLFRSNPGETGTGGAEVSYSGYQRQPVLFTSPAPMNTGHGIQNVADITFPEADVSIGNVTHLALLDSAIGGNMLAYGEFTEPININAQEAPVVIAGEAQWWFTGPISVAYRTSVLNLLRGESLTGATPHLALFSGHPEDGGSELIGENYARAPIEFSAPTEQESGQMIIQNSDQVSTPRATTNWGVVQYYAVMDAASGGQPMMYIEKSPTLEMRKGRMVVVRQGELMLTLN